MDDPTRRRGLRSRPFDGEGMKGVRRAIVEDGVLTTWILDWRSARQLNLASTGHASRGTGGPPSPSPTNLWLEPGTVTPAALMADIREGLYVTELIGMGVNAITGDYSRGAAGFMIRDGALAEPVSEITIAGNLRDMLLNLTPADDLRVQARHRRADDPGRGADGGGRLRRGGMCGNGWRLVPSLRSRRRRVRLRRSARGTLPWACPPYGGPP